MADRTLSVERHLSLAFLSRFCGHDNYTVTTLRAIDGCERGILQDVDRLYVGRRNIIDVIGLKAVDDVERVV